MRPESRRADGSDRADQYPRRLYLCIAAGSTRARARLAYYTPDRLALRDDEVFATVEPLACATSQATISTWASPSACRLSFDVVLLRQDPPFDLAYITTTHLLERIRPQPWSSTTRRRSATRRKRCSSCDFRT